jgi:hypothetical protein
MTLAVQRHLLSWYFSDFLGGRHNAFAPKISVSPLAPDSRRHFMIGNLHGQVKVTPHFPSSIFLSRGLILSGPLDIST